MHIEKMYAIMSLGLLPNVKRKKKDEVKAWQDLVDMGICSELHP